MRLLFNFQKNTSFSNYSVYSKSSNSANPVQYKYSFNVKSAPFQTIHFSIRTQFKSKYSLIVKNISISNYSV